MSTLENSLEKNVILPERFHFCPDEITLAIRAIGNYAISSLRIDEENWSSESLHAVTSEIEPMEDRIEWTRKFLDSCIILMQKLSNGEGSQNGVELSENELELIMDSLYRLGVVATSEAIMAITEEHVMYETEEDKLDALGILSTSRTQTRSLFKKLEPTAIEHKLERMIWDHP